MSGFSFRLYSDNDFEVFEELSNDETGDKEGSMNWFFGIYILEDPN